MRLYSGFWQTRESWHCVVCAYGHIWMRGVGLPYFSCSLTSLRGLIYKRGEGRISRSHLPCVGVCWVLPCWDEPSSRVNAFGVEIQDICSVITALLWCRFSQQYLESLCLGDKTGELKTSRCFGPSWSYSRALEKTAALFYGLDALSLGSLCGFPLCSQLRVSFTKVAKVHLKRCAAAAGLPSTCRKVQV